MRGAHFHTVIVEVKAVIFDLDGTLYARTGLIPRLIFKELFRGRLVMLGRERKLRNALRGKAFSSEEAFYEAFFGGGVSRDWYFGEYMPDTVRLLKKHYRIRHWVQPTMESLRNKGVKVAVLSDYGFVNEKLEAIGFNLSWADLIVDAPSVGGLKPCKAPFLYIAEKLGVDPSECVVVGDRPDTDGAGSVLAGMDFRLISDDSAPIL